MAKNWLGREDNTFDGMFVSKGEVPSIEGAVKSVTGVTLPFADMSRGGGAAGLLNNAAVMGEGVMRRLSQSGPQAESSMTPATPPSADRLMALRDEYLKNQRLRAGQGKSFNPSME
jgi:hypothetical protein